MLGRLEEDNRTALNEYLTAEERKELLIIYRYLMVADGVEYDGTTEITEEMADSAIDFYQDLSRGTEPEGKEEDKTVEKAFQTFQTEMQKKEADWKSKTGNAADFQAYVKYLQTKTTVDIGLLLEKLERLSKAVSLEHYGQAETSNREDSSQEGSGEDTSLSEEPSPSGEAAPQEKAEPSGDAVADEEAEAAEDAAANEGAGASGEAKPLEEVSPSGEAEKSETSSQDSGTIPYKEQAQEESLDRLRAEIKINIYELYGLDNSKEDERLKENTEDKSAGGITDKNSTEEKKDKDMKKKARSAPVSERNWNPAARINGDYYGSFNEAFDKLPDGGTLYVLRDCTAEHIVTEKSFSIYPEGQNVTVTFQADSLEPAGIITTEEGWHGTPTWTLGGRDGYTLTLDANRKGSSGVLACYGATINLESGVRLTNADGNGVWNETGTTNIYEGAQIFNNLSHGIATLGTVNLYGGEIYQNIYDGIMVSKEINVSGGSVRDNGGCGILIGEGGCTLTMSGSQIYRNAKGIGAYGDAVMNISGGEIYENYEYGIWTQRNYQEISGDVSVHNNYGTGVALESGELRISGGNIYSNSSDGNGGGIRVSEGKLILSGGKISGNSARNGAGVYFSGAEFTMRASAGVDLGNDVYLAKNTYITVDGSLQATKAARLTFEDYWNGRKAIKVGFGERKGSLLLQKFTMTSNGSYCLRPGDYQADAAGTGKDLIVLSTGYPVLFNKNITGNVQNMPETAFKYWYEGLQVPASVPSLGKITFKGWSENAESQTAQYRPGDKIPPSQNREMTLYALWGPQIKVVYAGNGNGKGTEKTETITARKCAASGGYIIQKNKGYTDFEKSGHKFMGWDINSKVSSKVTKFPDSKEHKLSFESLIDLAAGQAGGRLPDGKETVEVRLYAVWDAAPVLSAQNVQEFYEGTRISRKELLDNVSAEDKEDGNITKDIRIAGIEYAAGRQRGNGKEEAYMETWEQKMPEEACLDTWFEQLAEEDAPVEHRIIYEVTDSAGNETILKWPVRVQFNQFPVIEAEDRYFTLEEAQAGVITETVLIENALNEGKLKVTDKEEDVIHPGKIAEDVKLNDFHPEEFTGFVESGYVTVTYSVKDSMGPGGEGKETFRQCTVYIVKDGEIVKPDAVTYVRFINQEFYEKNLNVDTNDTNSAGNEEGEATVTNGGLLLSSKWYVVPEYKSLLSNIWAENRAAEEVWEIGRPDVTAIKSYVEEHGIGNSMESTSLCGFLEKFGKLQIL